MKKAYDLVIDFNEEYIDFYPDNTTISLKGWNLDDKLAYDKIKDECEEMFEERFESVKIIGKQEHAFNVQRFYDGQDAEDEGHRFWVETHDNYKKGLGKCTTFTIEIKIKSWDKVNLETNGKI